MKKLLSILAILGFIMGTQVFASDRDEAQAFFKSYVNAANTYSATLPNFYSPNAKITRQVIKPNGQLVDINVPMSTYLKQMKMNSSIAKMRKYKNYYSGITAEAVSNGYKINSTRKPSTGGAPLKVTMVVQKQANGKWLIVEELMQTREQIFLKYAK